jgi:hypothetical protein
MLKVDADVADLMKVSVRALGDAVRGAGRTRGMVVTRPAVPLAALG